MVDLVTPLVTSVDLWVISVAEPAKGMSSLLDSLSSDELARAGRLRSPAAYLQFVRTRAALRGILARALGCEARDLRFSYGKQGKPSLESPASALEFSVAHAAGLALVAVSHNSLIGVDLEPEAALDRDLDALRSVLSEGEEQLLAGSPEAIHPRRLLVNWTLKEAILKADGRGLSVSPREITILPILTDILAEKGGPYGALSEHWQLRFIAPRPGYIAAIASNAAAIDIRMRDWD